MSHILHVDASSRSERSVTRQLTREFLDLRRIEHPQEVVTYRDVGRFPVPHVTEAWIVGAFAPPEAHTHEAREAMAFSDLLIEELLGADRFVFGVPMYNFSVPSAFKAYVDQIVRVNKTIDSSWQGLVRNKKALFITARGGSYAPESPIHPFDFQEPWLRTIFGFIGVSDVTFVHAQALNMGDEQRAAGMQEAKRQLADLAKTW